MAETTTGAAMVAAPAPAEASPRPWEVVTWAVSGKPRIWSGNVLVADVDATLPCLYDRLLPGTNAANAALIVRAVNSHAALIAAAETVLNECGEVGSPSLGSLVTLGQAVGRAQGKSGL